MVILPWGDDKHPKNFNPFGAARAILDAVSETRLGPISATLLVEQAAPDAFCEFLIGLPKCIETFCVGLRDPNIENISADVWESLPKLQTINVSISRPNQGIMEPRNTFKRPKASHPRDDEPETTKRARTEVIDFATCTATVFLVPAFEEEASNAQTFQIAHERPIKFRAVAVDEIPGGEAFSLIDGPVNTLRPTADLRHVIDMVYVTEDSVKRIGVKPNIDASVVTGTSVWGRAVFLKK